MSARIRVIPCITAGAKFAPMGSAVRRQNFPLHLKAKYGLTSGDGGHCRNDFRKSKVAAIIDSPTCKSSACCTASRSPEALTAVPAD